MINRYFFMNNHQYEKTPLNPNLIKIYPDAIILNDKQCESRDITDLAFEANTDHSVSTGNDVMGADTKATDIK